MVPSSEAWTTPRAESDLELLAEDQVLDDEALMAADGGEEGGQDEPDEFDHRSGIAITAAASRRAAFCPPSAGPSGDCS